MPKPFSEDWLLANEYAWQTPGVAKFVLAVASHHGVQYSPGLEKRLRDAAGLPQRKLGDPPRLPRQLAKPAIKAKPPPVLPPDVDRKSQAAGERIGDE